MRRSPGEPGEQETQVGGDPPGELMEWLGAGAGAPVTDDGASLLLLRPARYRVGAIPKERWLRLIAWHGERATTACRAASEHRASAGAQ